MNFLRLIFLFVILSSSSFYFCYSNQQVKYEEIPDLLKKYKDNPLGWSRLNYAIEVNDLDAALMILQYTEDNINRKDPLDQKGVSKVHALERLLYKLNLTYNKDIGLEKKAVELILDLVENGINIKGQDGYRSLLYVCQMGIDDLIFLFVNKGAAVNVDNSYSPALDYTIRQGNLRVSRYLISKKAKIHNFIHLESAITSQKCEMINFVLEQKLEGNKPYNILNYDYLGYAFDFLTKEANNTVNLKEKYFPAFKVFQLLLAKGADPNFWKRTYGSNPNPTHFEQAFNSSILIRALNLPCETSTQYLYKEMVLNLLAEYEAVAP